MKHVLAIVIKFVMVAVVLEIVLSLLTALTFGEILVISLAVTAVSYLIGDLLILNFSNNITATLVDALLAFATIYLFNYRYGMGIVTYADCAIAAIVLCIGEWFFHKYVASTVFPKRKKV